ncbi:replicative DNA helicase [Streptomyces pacificus]|uniref:Replicative DNA helicase n=1 Tax=Streptomyces pacificus TaxID=2705029 RepID=A0A6A0APV8_9ACTN|nr:replicative DNA helicase [Streptomyces pacificus]GFH34333.1 replicative DNA helicase [Streptomyces pacificus]
MEDEIITRTPPQDLDAEQCVLGGMLLSKRAIAEVVEILDADDFYRPAHETVFRAVLDLYGKNEPADSITTSNYLRELGVLGKVGGPAYINELVRSVPTAANAGYYAEIVRDCAVRRRIVEAGIRITEIGYNGEGEAQEAQDAAQAELNAVTTVREEADSALIGEDLEDVIEELERLQAEGRATGLPTGFADLDTLTHGLHGGQMVIIAGRPGLGKSTLGVDMLRACSIRYGLPSAFFSLEMSRREVQHRIISAEARIGLHKIRGGHMTDYDWAAFANHMKKLAAAPLTIDATPNRTVTQIKARSRQIKQVTGLSLVVIDYLQLLETPGRRRPENRQVEVSEMSRGIKLMAKELDVPVVVLCQLNRGPEQRQDKRPMLADLRESGSLEQDADIVILVHREDAYDKESPRAGEADLIVAKHRAGPTTEITVAAQLHYSRFCDMAHT